ncbi:uncharacterized protein LOC132706927 [Cylas formicarius]|uniref:uncharacterized protein LOC132706927 n=1 Tax=Cylas formicarius TaxID=197179 RepID=UPI0029586448|nr:uncharacterized protein LOC132706927 [Cylas formicarius]
MTRHLIFLIEIGSDVGDHEKVNPRRVSRVFFSFPCLTLLSLRNKFRQYTVLHWGAKYGNVEIVKIFAGKYKVDVNGKTVSNPLRFRSSDDAIGLKGPLTQTRAVGLLDQCQSIKRIIISLFYFHGYRFAGFAWTQNGGYTPLHISAQFGHKDLFKLLIEVYKADPNVRDYSGRTAEYYLIVKEQKENGGVTLRTVKGRKKQSDKDLGFLRIGSFNVRVKKTTEAFSNFLGVGNNTCSIVNPVDPFVDKVHKGWGSADNVNKDGAGPKGYLTRKKSKRALDSGLSSTPTTPKTPTRSFSSLARNDSDSDSAGFDSNWKN